MTKARIEYIYKITGTIQTRTLHQAPPTSKYAGEEYYRLKIVLSDKSTKSIQVFPNKLANPTIWTTLKQISRGKFTPQKYTFHCRNIRGYYHLVDWEEYPKKGGQP